VTKFAPAGWLLLLFLAFWILGCGDDDDNDAGNEPDAAPDPESVLDGTEEVQEEEVAELAFDRAQLGAEWLSGVSREDGSFYYEYFPADDTYDEEEYNEVRHAGTTYSIFQVYGATGGDEILDAAEAAIGYIEDNSVDLADGKGFAYDGDVKLGGQALAIVALLERRRVTEDDSYDQLIEELSAFLLAMETDDPGHYYDFYFTITGSFSLGDSRFYPGEALLALTRLAYHFPDEEEYLDAAIRAADYLVYRRDGDLTTATQVPEEDHWLAIALAELYRLEPNEDYARLSYLHAESMVNDQITEEDGVVPLIGASGSPDSPRSFTSIATKGEALAAVWALAEFKDDDDVAEILAEASWRNAQFRMRVQYTEENTLEFPNPEGAIGAWGADPADESVRIDYVQHNITALIWVYHMTEEGDLPFPDGELAAAARASAGAAA
jgi:hypothetical protein